MRVKIVSGGLAATTLVKNADTGEPLEGVVGVTWTRRAGEGAHALVELEWVEVDVAGVTSGSS